MSFFGVSKSRVIEYYLDMKRGHFLADLRIKKGLSQSDVADILGYTPQLVSLWEKDKAIPDLSVIGKYASILGIDLEGFIKCKNIKRNDYCNQYNFDIKKFSNNLKYLRKKNNLYQNDVASKLSVNVKSVLYWESGSSIPSIDNFLSLCDLYKLSIDELYFVIEVDPIISEETTKSHKKALFITLPIVITLVLGSTATGLAIGLTNKNKSGGSKPVTCEHEFAVDTIEPTFESNGFNTYTCIKCGYSYVETIPQLEHSYSSTWTHTKKYHYHQCIDEGYENLKIDYGEHEYESTTIDGITTYTCRICDYSFDTSDYITVIDLYNENGGNTISVSRLGQLLYFEILNPTKYQLSEIGYEFVYEGYEVDGSLFISNCLDNINYTKYSISTPFHICPDIFIEGNSVTFRLTNKHCLDPNIPGINCDDYIITFIE